jgi:hypothetical protein
MTTTKYATINFSVAAEHSRFILALQIRPCFIGLFDWTCTKSKVKNVLELLLNLLITFIFSGTSVVQKEEAI